MAWQWYEVFTEDNSAFTIEERERLNHEYRRRWQIGEWAFIPPVDASKKRFTDEVSCRSNITRDLRNHLQYRQKAE